MRSCAIDARGYAHCAGSCRVADITYIRLAEEFVYLAVVMDAFSRKVVGWALADHLQASLPLEALDKAIASRGGR